jgi:hypothetical protein
MWAAVASGFELLMTTSLKLASISVPAMLDCMSSEQHRLATDVDGGITESSTKRIDLICPSGLLCELGSEIFDEVLSSGRTIGCTVGRSTVGRLSTGSERFASG